MTNTSQARHSALASDGADEMLGAFGIAESEVYRGAKIHRADTRIVAEIEMAVMRMALRVVERGSRRDVLGRLLDPPLKEAGCPGTVVRLQQDVVVAEFARHAEQIGGNLVGPIEASAGDVEDPQIGDCRRQFGRAFEPAPDRGGALDHLADLGRRPAVDGH
jgi:hypothetical protein